MRTFEYQSEGWEVALGHESWGTLVLLVTPVRGGEVRKSVLTAETALAAETELDAMTDDDLRRRLAAAGPW